jgi:hypothetical protein
MIILASCNKDPTTPDIRGTFKLKFLSVKTNSIVTDNGGGKLFKVFDYTTINNAGTIVIDGSNFSVTGFGYEINSILRASLYQDNQLVDSFSAPYNMIIPSTNSATPYKLIDADSIYFQNGSLTTGISKAKGGRYTMNGNLFTIKQNALIDTSYQDSGLTFHWVETILASVVMEKE